MLQVNISPSQVNVVPLQVEILERELRDMKIQLQEVENREVYLSTIVDEQRKYVTYTCKKRNYNL